MNKEVNEVFLFLSDLNNYKELLPEDKISDWESAEDYCSFKIKGATTIGFKKTSVVENEKIHLISTDNSPVEFTLDINLNPESAKTSGDLTFESNVNPFVRMMIEKPLKSLFEHMIDKAEKKFN